VRLLDGIAQGWPDAEPLEVRSLKTQVIEETPILVMKEEGKVDDGFFEARSSFDTTL